MQIMKSAAVIVLVSMVICSAGVARQQVPPAEPALSEETQACLECHKTVTPGIVEDWMLSRHAITTPAAGLSKPVKERRISNEAVPKQVLSVVVGCYECHSQRASSHKDNFEHFGYKINVVVSPADCATCHSVESRQYALGKKAHALGNLEDNPVYSALVETILGMKVSEGRSVKRNPASQTTKNETCYACHGTHVEVMGLKTVSTSAGDVEVPNLTNWPNQGVGRGNPDGSTGACTSCHPRHSFSIEIARKPHTCGQCHLKPDLPAWDVYKESKHGNIIASMEHSVNWASVPWTVGKDFRAPTCATCHNSMITSPDGETVVERNHDFGSRLWVRIFGLPYSHPQPKSGNTAILRNKDGLPLPTTFTGAPASEYLIDQVEQDRRQSEMKKVCQTCHGTSWSNAHFAKLAKTNVEADSMVLAATKLMTEAWTSSLANKTNPFDEAIEHRWIRQWLFYANSVRYASAMSGPDYATFENGWWELSQNLEEMREYLRQHAAKKK
ncbi:MAG: multiheme c-type cytochrome [Ignavibacteriales bacterium]|nr:multiheme c-type cytochrome [Ignavibacteriales bacterium]